MIYDRYIVSKTNIQYFGKCRVTQVYKDEIGIEYIEGEFSGTSMLVSNKELTCNLMIYKRGKKRIEINCNSSTILNKIISAIYNFHFALIELIFFNKPELRNEYRNKLFVKIFKTQRRFNTNMPL